MNQPIRPTIFKRITRAWRGIVARAGGEGPLARIDPNLPDSDLDLVRQQIDACISNRGGEVSARAQAAELGQAYMELNDEGKIRFLRLLLDDYDIDRASLPTLFDGVLNAKTDDEFRVNALAARQALNPPRADLIKQFNSLEEGVKFLVNLRADVIDLRKQAPDLDALNTELRARLESWLDVGFLELQRIRWDSPASLLEKLIDYEAVHEIRSWSDLKNRLDSDRRCFAFFHASMPDEPLIFVEVALVDGMAGNITELLDEAAPATDPYTADTAIFYSINNTQPGLAGVAFGDYLIKQVVQDLTQQFPDLKTFATLSPIPGFRGWLKDALREGEPLLEVAEAEEIGNLTGSKDPEGALLALLDKPDWHTGAAAELIKPILMRICAHYLEHAKRGSRILDGVGHFHLSNGACIERLNWLGDPSPNGMRQSAGMMVNYLYRDAYIEANHDAYKLEGKVATGNGFGKV